MFNFTNVNLKFKLVYLLLSFLDQRKLQWAIQDQINVGESTTKKIVLLEQTIDQSFYKYYSEKGLYVWDHHFRQLDISSLHRSMSHYSLLNNILTSKGNPVIPQTFNYRDSVHVTISFFLSWKCPHMTCSWNLKPHANKCNRHGMILIKPIKTLSAVQRCYQ